MAPDELRRLPLLVSLAIAVLIVMIELGATIPSVLHAATGAAGARPGYGIAYLVCVDGLLLYSLSLMAASVFLPRALTGRMQGLFGVVVSIVGLIALVAMILLAINVLVLMVSLLFAPLFGTIAYFALFADFARGAAAATLSVLVLLKIALVISLLLAQQRFLGNKSLVVLVLLSLACSLVVSLLQAFPPAFLVSITDALAAVIVAAVGIVWVVVLLIGSIVGVFKAVA